MTNWTTPVQEHGVICIAMLISAMVMTVFVFFDNWFINNAVMEEYDTALNGDEKEQRTYYEEKIRELLEEAEAKEVETLVSYENSKKIYEKNGNFFDDTDYIKCLSDVKILMDYISQMIQYNKYIPETKGLMTEEQGYYYDIAEDIINDITAVQHFANADGVVLVETVGKSNCQGIVDEMELAAKYDTKVLGVVKLGEVL